MEKGLVTGLFKNTADADKALDEIYQQGYKRADVSLLMSAETKKKELGNQEIERGTAFVGVIGTAGNTAGAANVAADTIASAPGLGLVVVGPLALEFAETAVATGGIAGVFLAAGVPEYRARVYDEGVREGGIVLGIEARTDGDADLLEEILEDAGAWQVTQAVIENQDARRQEVARHE